MADLRTLVREQMQRGGEPEYSFDDLWRRRARKRRNDRIAGAVIGVVVFAALAAAVLVSVRLDRSMPGGRNGTPTSSTMAPLTATASPFAVDLRTGDRTALPAMLVPERGEKRVYVNYSVSPDGTTLAYGACITFSCSGADVMRIASLDGTSSRTVTVPEGLNGYLPRWSPEGSALVYQLRDGAKNEVGNLFLQDVPTGRRTQLTDLNLSWATWWFLSASFTPDGTSVVFHLPRIGSKWDVWSVPVTGGEPTLIVRDATFPQYLPDGKTIAVVKPSESPWGTALQLVDADGSRRTLVEAHSSLGISWPALSPDGVRIAYEDGGSIYVVDVSSGESSRIAAGYNADWLDDHTLIVSP